MIPKVILRRIFYNYYLLISEKNIFIFPEIQ